MRIAFWRKRVKVVDRAETRQELRDAEQRLAHAERHVALPLREVREENHVGELLDRIIARRANRGAT